MKSAFVFVSSYSRPSFFVVLARQSAPYLNTAIGTNRHEMRRGDVAAQARVIQGIPSERVVLPEVHDAGEFLGAVHGYKKSERRTHMFTSKYMYMYVLCIHSKRESRYDTIDTINSTQGWFIRARNFAMILNF